MVSKEMIQILIQAEDQASQAAKQAEDAVKKMGDSVQKANQKAGQSSQELSQKTQMSNRQFGALASKVKQVKSNTQQLIPVSGAAGAKIFDVGKKGSDSFKSLSKSEQDSLIKFNMLDEGTQKLLGNLGNLNMGIPGLSSAVSDAKNKFDALEGATETWGGSLDYARSKIELLGGNTDSLRGKIQVVGNAIPTYLGTKWDGLKSKVSSFGNYIKTQLGNALQSVRSKLDSLSSAFSGLGGLISSAIGAIGMASISDMTIGLAMGREQMTALMQATTGSADAADDLINGYTKAGQTFKDLKGNVSDTFMGLDEMTNQSLVSLDNLGQAMSNFKMSTGATNDQLAYIAPTINDIGQRAILMGKDGGEALTLMQAAGQGLNGSFNTLHHTFGVTKDKLIELGWSGSAEDIEGYADALQKALDKGGDMNGMMETSTGRMETLKKNFRVAGRHVGELFTPAIDTAVSSLNSLYEKCPEVFQGLIGIAGGISTFATLAPSIAPTLTAFDQIISKSKSAAQFLGLMKGEEDALTLATLKETAAQKMNAIAKAAGGTAATAEAGANASLTASFWAMSTAILSNPLTWLVVALVAVAVAVYEVGKSFGWWNDVQGMLAAIWSGINRLWNMLLNNKQVKEFIKEFGDAWNWVCEALKPVTDWAQKAWNNLFPPQADGSYDIVRDIAEAFGWLGRRIASIVGAVKSGWNTFMGFINYLATTDGTIGFVRDTLKTIVCILLGCSPGIVPALESVQEAFTTVWNYIAGFIGGIISGVVASIQPVLDILTGIGNFLLSGFQFAWQTIIMVFSIVSTHINQLVMIFSQFLTGQISLSSALSMIWQTISSMWYSVLTTILSRIRAWALNVINKALEVGRGFVNNILNFIRSLPGGVGTVLYNVLSYIISAGSQWVSTAISKAQGIVTGVISNITSLPGKVYTEFANIGSRMLEAGSQLVQKAKDIGKDIVDGLLDAMGIHSPGIIQTKVATEFVNTVGKIEEQVAPAEEMARQMGSGIVEAFGNPVLETDTSNLLNEDAMKTAIGVQAELMNDLDAPAPTMSMGVDTAGVAAVQDSNNQVMASFNNLSTTTGNALDTMVAKDNLAYNTIRTNDSSQLSMIRNDLQNKMTNMTNKVRTSMDTMVNKNRTGLTSAKNTTQTQLNAMVDKTKVANQRMIDSWKVMQNGIIAAANKIRSDSTSHFDKLSSTIGTFYGKLKNPSRWGAGPGNGRVSGVTRKIGNAGNGVKRITQAVSALRTPQYLTVSQVKQNPLIDYSQFGDFIIRGKNNLYDTSQLIKYGVLNLPVNGGAGWDSSAPRHVKHIKDTSGKWDMKSPNIGRYATNSASFKVKEFETGTPRIDFNTFRRLAEEVYGQTDYEFYYDNDHHGNWLNAFNAGTMNCYHGAQSIIAMANAMGLTGNLVHGHWNQYGHFWANIAGHKMDVTGWQNHKNWSPAQSHAGPAPRSARFTFGDFIEELKNSQENTTVTVEQDNTGSEMVVNGNLTIAHEFLDLPEGVSAEEVARIVNESTANDSFIEKLVSSKLFQKLDLKEKAKIERRNVRARGA